MRIKIDTVVKRKTCIFCENTELSKEHFWSTWLHELIPDPTNNSRGYMIIKSGIVINKGERPGHLKNKTIRKVCKICNNGWMSKLETSVIPILKQMLNGSCVLQANEILSLSRWILLKVIIAEHDRENKVVTARKNREEFKTSLQIPENFSIWAGKFNAGMGGAAYMRHSQSCGLHAANFLPKNALRLFLYLVLQ